MSRVFGLNEEQVIRLRHLLEDYEAGALYPDRQREWNPPIIGGVTLYKGLVFETTGTKATTDHFEVDNIEAMIGGGIFDSTTKRTIANLHYPMPFGAEVMFLIDMSTQNTSGVGRLINAIPESDFILVDSTLSSVLDSSSTAGFAAVNVSAPSIDISVHNTSITSTGRDIKNNLHFKVFPNQRYVASRVRDSIFGPSTEKYEIISSHAAEFARMRASSTFSRATASVTGSVQESYGDGVTFPSSYGDVDAITINNPIGLVSRNTANDLVGLHKFGMTFDLISVPDDHYVEVGGSTGKLLEDAIVNADVAVTGDPHWPVSGFVTGGEVQLGAWTTDLDDFAIGNNQILEWKAVGLSLHWSDELNVTLGDVPRRQVEAIADERATLIVNAALGGLNI